MRSRSKAKVKGLREPKAIRMGRRTRAPPFVVGGAAAWGAAILAALQGKWALDVRLTTYDGRDRLSTMRHATVASRKVVMSLPYVARRTSHVQNPKNPFPSLSHHPAQTFSNFFHPPPCASPCIFATLDSSANGPGLPKRHGCSPFPFGLKGKTNEKANVCNGPRGVRCGFR